MAGYNELRGLRVKYLSADPANPEDGQVWYNSTTGNLRVQGIGAGAWSSSSSLGTGRYLLSGFGSQTAAVVSMGTIIPATQTNITEEYNGSGWSSGTSYPATGTAGGAAGTQTAGLIAGGQSPRSSDANEYDGSSWTATGSLPTAMDNLGSCGTETQTNVIMAVGRTPATGNSGTNTSVVYNGSIFSSGPNLNVTRMYGAHAGSGTGTAGLVFGGFIDPSPNAMTNTEEYNGSSWSNASALNVASSFCNGFGTQTNTVTNVNTPNYQGSEQYDGTSWTALPNIGIATPGAGYFAAAGNTGNKGFITAMGPTVDKTVEWNFSSTTITPAAWSSGGNMPASWYGVGASQFGTQNSGLSFAGNNPGAFVGNTASFLYNGSSWTATPSMSTARAYLSGFGTSTSAVGAGGATGPGAKVTSTEQFDGSSWTNGGALGTARGQLASAGASETSGVVFGGAEPAASNKTEEYDGSTWSAGNIMPTSTSDPGGNGIQTSAIMVGGNTGPATVTLEYDGTDWASGGSTIVDHKRGGVLAADNTSAIVCGGHTSPQTAVEGYDGTAWSTRPSMTTARGRAANVGTAASGFMAGGNPSATNATEEWNAETVTVNPANNLSVS